MKSFREYMKKLPAARRARIEEKTREKVAIILLQQAREAVGISQQALAARLHMSQPALSRFERRPNITMQGLRQYVEALGGKLEVNVVLPKQPRRVGARAVAAKAPARRIKLMPKQPGRMAAKAGTRKLHLALA